MERALSRLAPRPETILFSLDTLWVFSYFDRRQGL